MSYNCSGGEGGLNHTCTLHDNDELTTAGTNYVYVSCTDSANEHNSTNNEDMEMDIIGVNESTARSAIETGINSVLTSPTIYTDQQMYLRYDSGTQELTSFDKVANKNDQYWGFNYVTDDTNESISDMGTTFYTWRNWSLTEAQVVNQVQGLINSTKK